VKEVVADLEKPEDNPLLDFPQNEVTVSVASTSQLPECGMTGLDVAGFLWVFTQKSPLTTSDVIREATRWGVALDTKRLRALYRSGDLQPMLEIQGRASQPPDFMHRDEPEAMGTVDRQFRLARQQGRLIDPSLHPYRSWLEFGERTLKHPTDWWNGLIYSHWQLLALPHLSRRLNAAKELGTRPHKWVRLPAQHQIEVTNTERLKRIALVVTALEARYLPKLDPYWIRLSSTQLDQWRNYRLEVSAQMLGEQLQYDAEQANADAEWLLSVAGRLDPMGDWLELVKYADPHHWESLKGNSLAAMEHRIAAEILLLFIEELATNGPADPISNLGETFFHPLDERLSYHPKALDKVLDELGVSPYPRVVLLVEGDTEYAIVPKIVETLGFRLAPDLVRVINMKGIHTNLDLIAAYAATPFVGERIGDAYHMTRPPTQLMIAVDPDNGFSTSEEIEKKRNNIVKVIRTILETQGVFAHDEDLNQLVQIKTWEESCFEFAHFTNEELVQGFRQIDTDSGLLADEKLIDILQTLRNKRNDIKEIWRGWKPQPKKTDLIEVLWPILEKRIKSALKNENSPPQIAERIDEAWSIAHENRHLQFALRVNTPDSHLPLKAASTLSTDESFS
jgi:hypothetical protein